MDRIPNSKLDTELWADRFYHYIPARQAFFPIGILDNDALYDAAKWFKEVWPECPLMESELFDEFLKRI